jgi:transcriptional regulator with XRE-family HTH domain
MDVASLIRSLGKDDAEVARQLGVDRSTASRLRRGKSRPSFAVVQKLLALAPVPKAKKRARA